jgi:predicted DNA-binding transcriptional regulator AlpA
MQIEAFGVRAAAAAKFCGISKSMFLNMVRDGRAPLPARAGRATVWALSILREWVLLGMPSREKFEQMRAKDANEVVALP